MFDNSFTFWLFNFGVTIIWLVGSIWTGNYFIAIGAVFYLAFAMLIDLPSTSAEEGSNDPESESPDDGLSNIVK
jgi:hypothetical protein